MHFVDPAAARTDLYRRQLAELETARAAAVSRADAKLIDQRIRRLKWRHRTQWVTSVAHW